MRLKVEVKSPLSALCIIKTQWKDSVKLYEVARSFGPFCKVCGLIILILVLFKASLMKIGFDNYSDLFARS